MRIPRIALIALLCTAPRAGAQAPALPLADRVRLAEAFRLAGAVGDSVWPEWSKAPFAVLLVTADYEFLIDHPAPSSDFTLLGRDSVLRQRVWYRARQFPTNFQATFPAVGGVPTVVIGEAEHTEARTSTRWVITVLHEHFHQLQNSQPGYYAGVTALGLAQRDQTGMWMLNFPFPYSAPAVQAEFSTMSAALGAALRARGEPSFPGALVAYRTTAARFDYLISADDRKYFAFQCWQEGIARYTEYRVAQLASAGYEPSPAFKKLKDYAPYADIARAIMSAIEKQMNSVRLGEMQRTVVYDFGAAEGLVLDRVAPDWKAEYFNKPYSLETYFPPLH
jgi:hypothetical protein